MERCPVASVEWSSVQCPRPLYVRQTPMSVCAMGIRTEVKGWRHAMCHLPVSSGQWIQCPPHPHAGDKSSFLIGTKNGGGPAPKLQWMPGAWPRHAPNCCDANKGEVGMLSGAQSKGSAGQRRTLSLLFSVSTSIHS